MNEKTVLIKQYEITFKFNKNKLESNYYKDKYLVFVPNSLKMQGIETQDEIVKRTILDDAILKFYACGLIIDAINICTKMEYLNPGKIEEIKIEKIKTE